MAIPINLLLIGEDEYGLKVIDYLTREGYSPQYKIVQSLPAYVEYLKEQDWDIILSENVVNNFSALTALRVLKNNGLDIPFIIVASDLDEDNAVTVMQAGAHDYIYKNRIKRLTPAIEREIREAKMRQDIRRAKTSLRDSEKRMADIINFLPDATFAIDREGKVIVWNRAIEELTGVKASEMLGKSNYEYAIPFYGERRPAIIDLIFEKDIDPYKYYKDFYKNQDSIVAESEINTIHGKKYVWTKATPLFDSKGNIIGAIESIRDITRRFEAETAICSNMDNLKKTLEATVMALAITAEKRDASTAGHQQRTAGLAVAIAKEMRLPERKIESIRVAAILHDIGKISIPAEILNKSSKLNNIEMDLIKTHPLVGYEIVKTIPFEAPVAEIILQHHERLNGSGYPHGLVDEEILLEARILAAADVIEAMVSHRPYRPALGIEKAMEEVSKNRGILYDIVVVDACLDIYKKGMGKKYL